MLDAAGRSTGSVVAGRSRAKLAERCGSEMPRLALADSTLPFGGPDITVNILGESGIPLHQGRYDDGSGRTAYGLRCFGSYRPISPPPGSCIFVIKPQRASTTSAHSTPLMCRSSISDFRSSHIR